MKLGYTNRPIFFTCILGILVYCVFHFLDVAVYPQYAAKILPIRIVVVLWMIVCLSLFFRFPDDKLDLFAGLFLFPAAYGISLMCYIVGEGFSSLYYVGLMLVIIGSAGFTRISPAAYAGLMAAILVQHFALLSFLPVMLRDLMLNIFFLGSSVILSLIIQSSAFKYEKNLLHSQENLYLAATTDALTGLFNRRELFALLLREKVRSARSGRPYAVAIGDIDNFKFINDTYGHEDGDRVLIMTAGLLRSGLREKDSVGRWGGEEFLILMPDTDLKSAKAGVNRIRKSIENLPVDIAGGLCKVTMTFGLAVSSRTEDIDDVIRMADEALYRGKHGTKNCVIA